MTGSCDVGGALELQDRVRCLVQESASMVGRTLLPLLQRLPLLLPRRRWRRHRGQQQQDRRLARAHAQGRRLKIQMCRTPARLGTAHVGSRCGSLRPLPRSRGRRVRGAGTRPSTRWATCGRAGRRPRTPEPTSRPTDADRRILAGRSAAHTHSPTARSAAAVARKRDSGYCVRAIKPIFVTRSPLPCSGLRGAMKRTTAAAPCKPPASPSSTLARASKRRRSGSDRDSADQDDAGAGIAVGLAVPATVTDGAAVTPPKRLRTDDATPAAVPAATLASGELPTTPKHDASDASGADGGSGSVRRAMSERQNKRRLGLASLFSPSASRRSQIASLIATPLRRVHSVVVHAGASGASSNAPASSYKEYKKFEQRQQHAAAAVAPRRQAAQLWSQTVAADVLERLGADSVRRQEAIHEFCVTESGYLRDLRMVVQVFVRPIVRPLNILTADECTAIFANIADLIGPTETLLADLESRRAPDGTVDCVGDAFLCWVRVHRPRWRRSLLV